MAILDGNTRKIQGTDIEVSNLFILCRQPNPVLINLQEFQVDITFQCYASIQDAQNGLVTNQLKIEGLNKFSRKLIYKREYGEVFDYADIQMKAILMEIFPDSDPDLITFQPPHAE